ncbi:MAG: prolipoprotein diacylglyceryl transferase [Kiritimatiellae bacterium]|nr:prolipoprotein diacylglyceryl transferase [Kiritimatiellia bacterium]
MHPILIPGLPIQTYGLCVAVGMLLAWKTVEFLSGRKDLDTLVFLLLCAGIVGARVAHVVEYWHADGFDRDFAAAFQIWNGGLVFYGGLAAALLVFVAWCIAKKPDVLSLADALAVGVPLGHAFGRLGCFFFGCCWGRVSSSPLAVSFPARSPVWWAQQRAGLVSATAARSLPVLPVQLFESAALFALFAVLVLLYRRRRAWTAAAYLLGYGAMRFLMEFLRDDERPSLFGLSSAQLFSVFLIALGAVFFAWSFIRNGKHNADNR